MPAVKHYPKTHVAYVTETGAYSGEAIQRGFGRLFTWAGMHHVQPLGPTIGIYYDSPQATAAEKQHCDLCVPVGVDVQPSEGILIKDVGDVDVATMEYRGAQNIQRTYNELYGWIYSHRYQVIGAAIETYLSEPGQELYAEVSVPIQQISTVTPAQK